MGQPLPKPWTVAEFLEWERQQPERYEFVDGVIRMMTGGTAQHTTIKGNLFNVLRNTLRGSRCRPFVDGIKVVTDLVGTYPDVVVACSPVPPEADRIESPVVIIEVLSRSTADYDRGGKWVAYQTIPSLMHYALVSQDTARVDIFSRDGDDWRMRTVKELDGQVELAAIGCTLGMAQIYEDAEP